MSSLNAIFVQYLSCAAIGIALMAGASLCFADETYQQSTTDNQPQEAQTIKLEGNGRQASDKFTLNAGLSVFDVTYNGDSNFIVRLLDREGNSIDTLFNQIGSFKGERGFTIPKAGQYLLDISANGDWTFDIRQPRPTEGYDLPRKIEGAGYQATPFMQLEEGLTTFKFNYSGEGRFTANLIDRDGRKIESLISVLGPFSGSKPVRIEKPGIYFLNIGSAGDWAIDVQ